MAKLKLSPSLNTPLTVGYQLVEPGKVYDVDLNLPDASIQDALQKGLLVIIPEPVEMVPVPEPQVSSNIDKKDIKKEGDWASEGLTEEWKPVAIEKEGDATPTEIVDPAELEPTEDEPEATPTDETVKPKKRGKKKTT